MSLTRLAVRIAAVHALRGTTLAEGRVYDSSTTPLDAAIKQQPLPFIQVTTDNHEREVTGRDLAHGDDALDLVIEVAIASRVTASFDDGGEEEQVVIPNTDAGMEMTLDLIEAQIAAALTWNRTAWAGVFGLLVPSITRRVSRRGASAEDGNRFAARQIVLTCNPIADPVTGAELPPDGAWAAFFRALDADPKLAAISPLLRHHIEGAEVPTWERMGRLLAIPQSTVAAMGEGPVVPGGAAPISEIVTEAGG